MPEPALPASLTLPAALALFVQAEETQSQRHIKPLHQHLAMRLVIEGGFLPEEITPRPAIRIETRRGRELLVFDESVARTNEQTVLGGLKTKAIDVVVEKPGFGPVIAISVKGTTGAFRNLTNRMEEAIGDSTNLHIMYPGLVYGFFQIIKANRAGTPGLAANDFAIDAAGQIVTSIRRYHDVLTGLSGRRFVRDDFTRYEAVGFALVETVAGSFGEVLDLFQRRIARCAPNDSCQRCCKLTTSVFPTSPSQFRRCNAASGRVNRLLSSHSVTKRTGRRF